MDTDQKEIQYGADLSTYLSLGQTMHSDNYRSVLMLPNTNPVVTDWGLMEWGYSAAYSVQIPCGSRGNIDISKQGDETLFYVLLYGQAIDKLNAQNLLLSRNWEYNGEWKNQGISKRFNPLTGLIEAI